MEDSIIAIIAAAAIGLIQLIAVANKKKKQQARTMQKWAEEEQYEAMESDLELEVEEVEEVSAPFMVKRMLKPHEEGGPMAKPVVSIAADEADLMGTADEEESLFEDFTPQKAILFSEVLKPKWNS
ncbi:MAG: hypothetical protein FWD56_08395 [Bacteroidales bacterium]|nr:hypothetical protein [Bacteroidales bacterium]